MQTLNFNGQPLTTVDPAFDTKGNTVSFTGTVGIDLLNLDGHQVLGQNLLLNPISWTFSQPVSSVSFDADVLGLSGSTSVTYYDASGHVLDTETNSILGNQHFEYSNPDIARVVVQSTSLSGFDVDNIQFQDANALTTTIANSDGNPLISGHIWNGANVSYSLPAATSDYTSSGYQSVTGFQQVNGADASEIQQLMASVSSDTGTAFTQTTGSAADIRIGAASSIDTGDGAGTQTINGSTVFGPSTSSNATGDVWLQAGASPSGLDVMKDVGQALGLQAGNLGGAHDSIAYSVMSNDTHPGGSPVDLSTVDAPSTFMQDDIAALQTMYGANFNINNANSVYSWDPATGQEFINGVGQGAPSDGKVFMTVWDGGGNDTFDFSAYTSHVRVDLQPGAWTSGKQLELANLGDGNAAPGNIAMAQLYQNNTQSLIENANGGAGIDKLIGNTANNVLNGGGGSDTIFGHGGDDTLIGVTGRDTLSGGGGNDTLNGGAKADLLIGGSGNDTFVYSEASDSTGRHYDTISGFNAEHDKFQVWTAVTGIDAHQWVNSIDSAQFSHQIARAASGLGANHAELITVSHGTYVGDTFLVIDTNGVAGYQQGSDLLINLGDNPTHLNHLSTSDFLTT